VANEQYVTLESFQDDINLTDTNDNAKLERIIEDVSRLIDDYCGFPLRHFSKTAEAAVRYFTAGTRSRVWIEDAVAVTEVALDRGGVGAWAEVMAASDYVLEPLNASEQVRPYTSIVARYGNLPAGVVKGVRVTGTFGWSEVPSVVRRAAMLQVNRLFKRTDAPLGVAGAATFDGGGMRLLAKLDADVEVMLRGVRRSPILVA
jgi:hypothetical protein